jgi:hypothetical protein
LFSFQIFGKNSGNKAVFYGALPNSSFMSQYKGLVYSAHEYNFTKVFTEYQQSHMQVKSI